MTPVRREDHDRAALEWLACDGAVEGIQPLCPAAHDRAQPHRGVPVDSRTEQRWHRQADVPIEAPRVEHAAHLTDPVSDVDLGTP